MIQTAVSAASTQVASSAPATPIPLTACAAGTVVRLHGTSLDPQSCDLLRALGLTRQCQLTLCKAGEPCIVQVRSTRIGLSRAVASGIFVVPDLAGA
jgi:Fe2+ transport system protein FeoA